MPFAFDGASPFSLTDAKKAGGVLITGYIVGHPGGYAPIDRQRVQDILRLGMGFLPNWERGAGYLVTCGRSGGKDAGQEAVDALRVLDIPDGIACPFSWDVHVDPSLYRQCATVAEGILDGLNGHYQFSAYGQGGLIAYLRQAGLMKPKGWLSGSSSFPGYDRTSPHIGMYQEVGNGIAGTDRNTITDPRSLGALWPAGSPFLEDDMPTPADLWDAPIKGRDGHNYTAASMLTAAAGNAADAKVLADKANQRAAAAQAALATQATELNEIKAQLADLLAGKITVTGTLPATVTIGGQS